MEAHDQSQPTQGRPNSLLQLYWSVYFPARLVEAHLPLIIEEAQLPPLQPAMVPVDSRESQLPVCLLHIYQCVYQPGGNVFCFCFCFLF